jgi:histidinol-phosphatase (PHP family)
MENLSMINHHIHTTASDGRFTPREVIEQAIASGLKFICFTDHYPYPPGTVEWRSTLHSEDYVNEITKLKKEFADKIEISLGAEFNWMPDHIEWTKKEIQKTNLDYALGAIHNLPDNNGDYPTVNSSEEEWKEIIKKFKGIKKVIKEYYKQVILAAESGLFDCIAHMDIVKVWNQDSQYFAEDEDGYKQQVIETLNKIAQSKICVEINTAGLYNKAGEQYPSFWIIKEMKKRDIPITIGSDFHGEGFHHGKEVTSGLREAIELAKKAGYDSIVKFKNRNMIKIPI